MGTEREPRTADEWKAAYFRMMETRDALKHENTQQAEEIVRLRAALDEWQRAYPRTPDGR